MLGPLIGGYIGEHYSLKATYLFAACVFILSTLIIFGLGAQPVESRSTVASQGLFQNRAYLVYLGIIFVMIFATYLPQPLTPNFLQNQRGLSVDEIGIAGAAGSLGNVLLNLSLGRLNAFHGFLLGQVSVGIAAIMLWRGTGLPWYLMGYFLIGGQRVARSLSIAQIRAVVHTVNMGLAYGITETVSAFAMILVSPLAGFIYDLKPEAVYQLTIVLVCFSLIVSAGFSPRGEATAQQLSQDSEEGTHPVSFTQV